MSPWEDISLLLPTQLQHSVRNPFLFSCVCVFRQHCGHISVSGQLMDRSEVICLCIYDLIFLSLNYVTLCLCWSYIILSRADTLLSQLNQCFQIPHEKKNLIRRFQVWEHSFVLFRECLKVNFKRGSRVPEFWSSPNPSKMTWCDFWAPYWWIIWD